MDSNVIIPRKPILQITQITVLAYYERLGDKFPEILAMADAAAAQGDYSLKAEMMKLDKAEFVDLKNEKLKSGIQATGKFTPEELDEVYRDGEPHEVPESHKRRQ